MVGEEGSFAELAPALEKGLSAVDELYRCEKEITPLLLSMDLRGLAAAVEKGSVAARRGEQLMKQMREVTGGEPLRDFLTSLPQDPGSPSCRELGEALAQKLLLLQESQELNRRLVEGGAAIILRAQKLFSGGRATYDSRGEFHGSAAEARASLDHNC